MPELRTAVPVLREDGRTTRSSQSFYANSHDNEWYINPAQHGPDKAKRPPAFVRPIHQHDDLGHSLSDGISAHVEAASQPPIGSLSAWYSDLTQSQSSSKRTVRHSPPDDVRPRIARRASTAVIDLTGSPSPPASSCDAHHKHNNTRDWFSDATPGSSLSSPRHHRTLSMGRLLDSAGSHPRNEPHYALGNDNKGHQILRDGLAWKGGGLGRYGEASGGRIAPVGVALKFDRRGLGAAHPSGRTKVTHTTRDIRRAQTTSRINLNARSLASIKLRVEKERARDRAIRDTLQ